MRDFTNEIDPLTGRDVNSFEACQNCRENHLMCDGKPREGCGTCTRAGINCFYHLKLAQCPPLPSIEDSFIPKLSENSPTYLTRLREALRPGLEEMERKKEEARIESAGSGSFPAVNPKSTTTPYKIRDGLVGRIAGRYSCNDCGLFICPNGNSFTSKKDWIEHLLLFHSHIRPFRCTCPNTSDEEDLKISIDTSHSCEVDLKGEDELTEAEMEIKAERQKVSDMLEKYITDRVWWHLPPLHQQFLDDPSFYGGSNWTPSIDSGSVATTSSSSPGPNGTTALVNPSSNVVRGTTSISNSTATPTSSADWPPPDFRKNNPIYFAKSSLQATPPRPIKTIPTTRSMVGGLPGIMERLKLQPEKLRQEDEDENAPVIIVPVKLCRSCQRLPSRKEVGSQFEEAKSLLKKRENSLREEREGGSERRK